MGLMDKIFGDDRDKKKAKPDFSDVRSGSSSTAPDAPVARPPVSDRTAERTYTVRAGDSLSKIAQREYGDASQWRRIYDANRDQITNPDLIHPGQTFRIPQLENESR